MVELGAVGALDLPEDIVGFKQVKLEAIPGRHWLTWKPRHIRNQTGENMKDIEAQLRNYEEPHLKMNINDIFNAAISSGMPVLQDAFQSSM